MIVWEATISSWLRFQAGSWALRPKVQVDPVDPGFTLIPMNTSCRPDSIGPVNRSILVDPRTRMASMILKSSPVPVDPGFWPACLKTPVGSPSVDLTRKSSSNFWVGSLVKGVPCWNQSEICNRILFQMCRCHHKATRISQHQGNMTSQRNKMKHSNQL